MKSSEQAEYAASVVIPARNAAKVLSEQLGALAAQDYDGRWETIVADNGSADDTLAMVERLAPTFPVPLRVVDASRAAGVNVARNVGAEHARGATVLYCDADDVVSSTWVRAMVTALEQFDIVGTDVDLTRLNSGRLARLRRVSAPELVGGCLFPIGASIACTATAWNDLGGFDESLNRGGWDERDFCVRAQCLGLSIGKAHGAVVHYRLRAGVASFLRQQFRIGLGEAQFRRKHPDYLAPPTFLSETVQVPRMLVGLALRWATWADDRVTALGWAAQRVGLDTETVRITRSRGTR